MTHNTKPFVNRVRYVPEVASRPERIEKDLANTKILASILEEEAAALRKSISPSDGGSMDAGNDAKLGDVAVGNAHPDNEDDSEPKEDGSQAVERRIEKIIADLREQGLDEKTIEVKKVSHTATHRNDTLMPCVARNFFGFVPCLLARSISHMLLLRCCYRSF